MKFLKITLTVFTGAALMMLSACGNKEALPLGQFCWEQTSDYTWLKMRYPRPMWLRYRTFIFCLSPANTGRQSGFPGERRKNTVPTGRTIPAASLKYK